MHLVAFAVRSLFVERTLDTKAQDSHPSLKASPRTVRQSEFSREMEPVGCAYTVVVLQLLSHVRLFETPWTAACQASLSFTISLRLLKPMSVRPSNHFTSVSFFSPCLLSFLASGSFPMSQLFALVGQSIGASASASDLPMNI